MITIRQKQQMKVSIAITAVISLCLAAGTLFYLTEVRRQFDSGLEDPAVILIGTSLISLIIVVGLQFKMALIDLSEIESRRFQKMPMQIKICDILLSVGFILYLGARNTLFGHITGPAEILMFFYFVHGIFISCRTLLT